jgi:cell division protein FtsX
MEVLKMTDHQETIKSAVDAASVVTVVGTLMEVLPAIAALFTIAWTCIRIYETKTVQKWVNKNAQQE